MLKDYLCMSMSSGQRAAQLLRPAVHKILRMLVPPAAVSSVGHVVCKHDLHCHFERARKWSRSTHCAGAMIRYQLASAILSLGAPHTACRVYCPLYVQVHRVAVPCEALQQACPQMRGILFPLPSSEQLQLWLVTRTPPACLSDIKQASLSIATWTDTADAHHPSHMHQHMGAAEYLLGVLNLLQPPLQLVLAAYLQHITAHAEHEEQGDVRTAPLPGCSMQASDKTSAQPCVTNPPT